MTTTDSSFVAQGPAAIGFYARGSGSRPATSPFKLGALAVGHQAGIYGATDDAVYFLPPASGWLWEKAGILGASDGNYGVAGFSTGRAGVYGFSNFGWGVRAWSNYNRGVYAGSADGYGVLSWSENSSGVFGQAGYVAGPTVPNVPNIAGVIGSSDTGFGVIGTSNTTTGVVGFSNNGIGVVGQTNNPGSFAGFFIGNVHMTGTLSSDVPKGTVVPFPDGTRRLLYCMESPEVWFEDFGTAKLKDGRAVVRLDPDFARVIKRGYRVFLTPEGDCRGLFVRRKSAASFEVRELMGGKSSIAFSYRIVGQRKDIKEHRRFAKIDTRLRLPVARARSAPRTKVPHPTPTELRAFAARMEKLAAARSKRGGKRKRSAT